MSERPKLSRILYDLVNEHFKGDNFKARLWFKIPNPMLGNIKPIDMIRYGRQKKLLQYIKEATK